MDVARPAPQGAHYHVCPWPRGCAQAMIGDDDDDDRGGVHKSKAECMCTAVHA